MSVPIRVLLVEDSEEDALLLVRELKRGGYEPATNGSRPRWPLPPRSIAKAGTS